MTSRTTLALLVAMVVAVTATAFGGDQRVLHADAVQLQNGSNYVQLQAPTLSGNTTFTLPSVAFAFPASSGTSNYVLRTNGAGVTTWVDALTTLVASDATHSGYLSSTDWAAFNAGGAGGAPATRTISTTAPLAGGGNLSADRTLSITQAATAANGYLSSTDWNTFNTKVGTATAISTTAPLAGGGDLSTSRTLSITQSGTAGNGYLSSTDWNTFNSKQAAISVNAPITLSTNTVGITQSGTAANGYLSSTDWNTFNNKDPARTVGNLTEATSSVLTITGGTGAVIGSGTTIAVTKSDTTHNGYLSSTDWTTFNNKVSTTRAINTTAPITGGGDLSADRTIAITQSGTAANGYLSSTDWNTFNSIAAGFVDTTNVAYSAGNFATGAGTWTVDSGDLTAYEYSIIGKRMFFNFAADTTTTSSTNELRVTIPASKTAQKRVVGTCVFFDGTVSASTLAPCLATAAPGAAYVSIFHGNDTSANFNNGTNNMYFRFSIQIPVN